MKTQSSTASSNNVAHKSGFVCANGIRLHYLDWGGLGPVLILIHGGLDNAHIFDDLAPTFTDHFRVIAYDLRGHGHPDPKGPFDTTTRTEDLRGLMDSLGIAKAHLTGWSLWWKRDPRPWRAFILGPSGEHQGTLRVRTIGPAQPWPTHSDLCQ